MSLGRLGGVYALLHAAHEVADHIVQTNDQAIHKGDDDTTGQRACAAHVLALTATQGVALAAGCLATGVRLRPSRVALGLAINAVSHYAADRRDHGALPKLVAWLDRHNFSKGNFYRLGDGMAAPCGTGAYAIDQAWHTGFNAIAAGSGKAA